MHDGYMSDVEFSFQQLYGGVTLKRLGQLSEQSPQREFQIIDLLEPFGVEASLARIPNILGALQYLIQVDRHIPHGTEQVNLHDQRVHPWRIIEHVEQGRIGHYPTVPIRLATDHHGRKAWR